MNSKLIVLALLCVAVIGTVTSNPSDGYYWREYNGKIPFDAFPGGVDKEGNPIYVGLMFVKGYGVIPATIVTRSNSAFASSNEKFLQSDEDIKILCSVEQHKFKWITTKIGDEYLFTSTNDCPLVNASTEPHQLTPIGRINHEGETIIGRVFSYWEGHQELWMPYNGSVVHFTSYESLTFDCVKLIFHTIKAN